MNIKSLFGNIRFYILLFSAVLAASIYIWVKSAVSIEVSQAIILDRLYALIAVGFLYFTLLRTPLVNFFPNLPYRELYKKSQRALGVSAFFFALLHAYFSFFGELGGFGGLGFLSNSYILAISLSATALLILFLLAATSFDLAIEKLTFPKWKKLQRFVYLAGLLTVIHGLLLGSDFSDFSGAIPQIFIGALFVLVSLEMFRLDKYLEFRFTNWPRLGLGFAVFLVFVGIIGTLLYAPSGSKNVSPFNVHAQHIQLAKDAQNAANQPASSSSLPPSLQGDRTRRFTISLDQPPKINPGEDVALKFTVFDASSGNQVKLFSRVYEKYIHLIIVDSELKLFNHIHPDQTEDGFVITTSFPKTGQYHLYINLQPLGAIEQQFAFTVNVGDVSTPVASDATPDTNLVKTFDDYEVTLAYPSPLKASSMSIGEQKLTFTFKDAKTKQPITTLKPYLAAFGHLVMINKDTYDYLHVHPTNLVAPTPDQNGGPTVEFLPLGLYAPIKPGVYRVFAQFNPNGQLMVADFTVKIE